MSNLMENMKKMTKVGITLTLFLFTWLSIGMISNAAETIPTVTETTGEATYVNGSYTYEFTYTIGATGTTTQNASNTCKVTKITCGGTVTTAKLDATTKVKYNSKSYTLRIVSVGNDSGTCMVESKSSKALATLTLSKYIEEIKPGAFQGFSSVKTVTFANGSACATIGERAFRDCTSLTTVRRVTGQDDSGNTTYSTSLPSSVKTIEASAFKNSGLTSFNTNTGVTSIGVSAFEGCASLNTFTLGTGVTTIGTDAFKTAPLATKLVYNAINCTTYNNTFTGKQIVTIEIGTAVTQIPANFIKGNITASAVTIPKTCTLINESAFEGCSNIKTVTFTTTSTCASIGEYAFKDCTALANIKDGSSNRFPASVKTIGKQAFANTALTLVDFHVVVSVGEEAFSGCTKLNTVYISSTMETIGKDAFKGAPLATEIRYWPIDLKEHNNVFVGKEAAKITFQSTVTKIPAGIFKNCSKVTSLAINNECTEIGASAFEGCTSVTSVTVGTGVESIGTDAFKDVPLTATLTYNATNCTMYNNAFTGKQAATVAIGTGVTQIPDNFVKGNTAVASITIPKVCKSIGESAFEGCTKLATVTFTATATCESIGNSAFSGCSALTNVKNGSTSNTIPASVIQIGDYAFANTGFTTLNMQNDTSLVLPWDKELAIGNYAFYNCTKLGTVTINNNFTLLGNSAFENCTALNKVTLGASLRTIGTNAFKNAPLDTEIVYNPAELITHNNAFVGKQTAKITFNSSVMSIPAGIFKNCSALTSLTINNECTEIGASAFEGCSSVNTVTIGTGVRKIGVNAFKDVPVATTLTFNAVNCTEYNSAFVGKQTATVTIGTSVTQIPENFIKGNSAVAAITIPKTCTAVNASAFEGCSKLATVTFTATSKCTTIGNSAFKDCSALTNVKDGSTSRQIPLAVTTIGDSAFENDTALTGIIIRKQTTDIGASSFRGCTSLATLQFESSSTCATIGDYAFAGCTSLVNAGIKDSNGLAGGKDHPLVYQMPNTITSIGKGAFQDCSSLVQIDFAFDSVSTERTIGADAFNRCFNLANIYLQDNDFVIDPGDKSAIPRNAVIWCQEDSPLIDSYIKPNTKRLLPYVRDKIVTTTQDGEIKSASSDPSKNGYNYSSKTYASIRRMDWYAPCTYVRAMKCKDAGTKTKTASATFNISKDGGSYGFDLVANACNVTSVNATVKITNKNTGELVGKYATPTYGATETTGYDKHSGVKHYEIKNLPEGYYKISVSTKFSNTHDQGEYVGIWILNDHMAQAKAEATCIDIDMITGKELGRDTKLFEIGTEVYGSDWGSSEEVGIYYPDYKYISCTSDEVAENGTTKVKRYFINVNTKYNVTYDGNGGSGSVPAQKFGYGETISVQKNENTGFVKTGYTFNNWNTEKNPSTTNGKVYAPGAIYGDDIPDELSDVVLHAQWKGNTYTVTYNGNGGTGSARSDSFTVGSDHTTIRSNWFTKKGYSFTGSWNTKADGTGDPYTPNTVYGDDPSEYKNLPLYAQWKPNTYTVTYMANGGTGSVASQSFVYGGSGVKVSENANPGFTYNGYKFTGWNTKADGTGIDYAPGVTYSSAADLPLYAQWEKLNVLTVDPNGGTWNGNSSVSKIEMQRGETLDIPVPAYSGNTFKGWLVSASAEASMPKTLTIGKYKFLLVNNNYDDAGNSLYIMADPYDVCSYIDSYGSDQNPSYDSTNLGIRMKDFGTSLLDGTDYDLVARDSAYAFVPSLDEMRVHGVEHGLSDPAWTSDFDHGLLNGTTFSSYGCKICTTCGKSQPYTTYQCISCGFKASSPVNPCPRCNGYAGYRESCYFCNASAISTRSVTTYAYCEECHKTKLKCSFCNFAWSGTSYGFCPKCGSYANSNCENCGGSVAIVGRTAASLFCEHCADGSNVKENNSSGSKIYICSLCGNSNLSVTTDPSITKARILKPNLDEELKSLTNINSVYPGIIAKPGKEEISSLTQDATFTMGNYDVTLTAQWGVTSTKYTVNHYYQKLDGTYPSTPNYSIPSSGTIGKSVTPALREETGFTSPAAKTIALVADESKNVVNYYYERKSYTVTANAGTGISSVSGGGSYKYGAQVTLNAVVKAGYTWETWTGTYDSTTQKYIFTMPAKDVTETAKATINTYTISYVLNGGSVTGNPTSYTVETATFTLKNPSKIGYIFKGWTGSNGTTPQTTVTVTKGSTGNRSYTANWDPATDTKYVVNHYKMDLNGTTYTLADTEQKQGTTDATLTISGYKKTYTGFTYEGGKGTTAASAAKPASFDTTTTILPDGSRVINLYYKRNQYTLTVKPNGGIYNAKTTDTAYTLYYEETKTIENPSYTGYTFGGWTLSGTGSTLTGKTFKMGTANAILTAKWTANTYGIAYELNGGTHGASHPDKATWNVSFTVSNPTRDGFVFQGWTITGMDKNTHYYGSLTSTASTLPYTVIVPSVTTFKNLNASKDATVTFTAVWKDVTAPELSVAYVNVSDETGADRDGIDQGGLTVTAGVYTPGVWTPNSVKVTATGTDKGTGVKYMKWADGTWITGSSINRTYTASGEHSGTAHAKDGAGTENSSLGSAWIANTSDNEASILYGVIKIDKKAPTAQIKKDGYNADGYTNGPVKVNVINAKDQTGGSGLPAKLYSWDHGTTWTATASKTYTNNVEDYVLVRDSAGNYRKIEYEVSGIDKRPPGVDPGDGSEPWEKIGEIAYPWVNYDMTLSFEVTDTTPEAEKDKYTASGIKTIRIYRSDATFSLVGENATTPVVNNSPGVESSSISFTCTIQGITYWILEAKDYADNVTKIQITVRIDKTDPVVTCNPKQFDLNAYGIDEVESIIRDDSKVYCSFNIKGKDYNDSSRGTYVSDGDSSGIKQVVLRIIDADDDSSLVV